MFLDEIGEMPVELQVRILRLVQEHEIDKIGSTEPTKVNIRIIAATHRNLEAMVEDGTFREDLYYRLTVVPIEIPPLRERPSDILELLQYFFERGKQKHSRPDLRLSSRVTACLYQLSLAAQRPAIRTTGRTAYFALRRKRNQGGRLTQANASQLA